MKELTLDDWVMINRAGKCQLCHSSAILNRSSIHWFVWFIFLYRFSQTSQYRLHAPRTIIGCVFRVLVYTDELNRQLSNRMCLF